MNSDERILQILDNSACLSKGQMTGYLKHTLFPEELRAVELHLSSCAFCNDALDGLELQQDPEKLLASLVLPALPAISPKEKPKEKKETPVIVKAEKSNNGTEERTNGKKNTRTEAPVAEHTPFRSGNTKWLRPLGIAAGLVLAFGALWYFELRPHKSEELAMNADTVQAESIPEPSAKENPKIAAAAPVKVKDTVKATHARTGDTLVAANKSTAAKGKPDSARKTSSPKAEEAAAQVMAATAPARDNPEKEDKQSEDAAAKKKTAALAQQADVAPAAAKVKEETKKKELTDYEKGLQLYKQKQYGSALLYLRAAESDASDPKHWDAVYYSALCHKNLDKKRKAIKMFQRVIDAGAPQKTAAQKQIDELKKKDAE
jgi:hypothetical protein